MADSKKKSSLPWGMSKDALKPNSVQSISKSKLNAFSLGMMNPLKRATIKKKEEKKIDKKMAEAKETAEVFEEFVASFEDTGKTGKTFVRGSTFNPEKTASMSERPKAGGLYKPSNRIQVEKEKEEPPSVPKPLVINLKPQKKKGTDKKKSILELFREELKRNQEERKERHAKREAGLLSLDTKDDPDEGSEMFQVEEYKSKSGSYDSGDSLTTNLYVGNINPKMNEEMLCQMFGKFGPLASVKVMWPRTEEERAKNRNCGFVAFMKRQDAEKALEHFKGTTIMEYEVQVGWGKAVPLPPHPVYVPPDVQADEKAKHPDPPSGLPFNAQPMKSRSHKPGDRDSHGDFSDDTLYHAMIRVVIPTDIKLLRLIHRMIEFVIREGPMFEAVIMNKEINNPLFQFLFDNQGPAHLYYRWKLFSILQGDSPETWRTEEFRMFDRGSLWKPPPLKNLRMKMLPPVEEDAVLKRGQLSSGNRDELEDQLRHISMERGSIRKSMVWCLDHADSAEEIVDCISEALTIEATPLPMKLARLFLVSDILHNCSSSVRYSSNFRRGFEGKLNQIFEHFNTVLQGIPSRMRAENFKRRVLACIKSWDMLSIYHFNLLDKLRETFFGKTQEEVEKQRAFDTVAALMATKEKRASAISEIDGVPLFDDRPIDFSGIGHSIDGIPLEQDLDGAPLPADDIDGVPLGKTTDDLDGVPMESSPPPPLPPPAPPDDPPPPPMPIIKSKWELVDYDSDDEDGQGAGGAADADDQDKEKQQLLSELEERKRRILRDVEVKVVELSDALESSGSYSKQEIRQRVEKYRDKLMKEAVIPKMTPPSTPDRVKSRSPSPSTLAKYELEEAPKKNTGGSSPKRKRSKSPKKESPTSSKERSRKRSRSESHSPPPKKRKSSSERKSSPPSSRRRSRSRSRDKSRRRSQSRSPKRKKSRERSSPVRKRSPSPSRRGSKSRSPHGSGRKRSRSPKRSRHRSRSPRAQRHRSRSKSPGKSRHRSRSRSPNKSRHRSRSRSPNKSRHRSRSKSPGKSRHRSRSKSPKSSKKKRRSRSRSPQKSSKSSKKSSRH